MIDARRLAYLDALDIPVWEIKVKPAALDGAVRESVAAEVGDDGLRLVLTPGSSGILLICDGQGQTAGKLASDVARALPESPVWAWPAQAEGGTSLGVALQAQLFTSVIVFGRHLMQGLFGPGEPSRAGTAQILMAPDFESLEHRGDARRQLWMSLARSGLTARL